MQNELKLDGGEVVFVASLPDRVCNRLVLVWREHMNEWVTGLVSDDSAKFGEWVIGHYRSTETGAVENFLERYRQNHGTDYEGTRKRLHEALDARRGI